MTTTLRNWLVGSASAMIAVAIVFLTVRSGGQVPAQAANLNSAARLSVVQPSLATADVGQIVNIGWKSGNYVPATVSVSVIRKVSDHPASYELVRTVALSTRNDGSAVWDPAPSDVGPNTFIQVGCTLSAQACTAGVSSAPLAVTNDGRYANTAASYQAIEAAQDR